MVSKRQGGTGTTGKPRGLRRDRDCHACRQRGVKCDLNRPRCRQCVEEGLQTCEYPQRIVWKVKDVPAPSQRRLSTTSPPVTRDGAASIPAPRRPSRQHDVYTPPPDEIGRKWQEAIQKPTTDIDPGAQPTTEHSRLIERLSAFCRTVMEPQDGLGMDIDSVGLRNTPAEEGPRLVARVDSFLQARLKGNDCLPGQDEYEFNRLATLSSLNEVLVTADPLAFLAIAVFAFFEIVSENAFGEWQRHLIGARSLLDYHCHDGSEFWALSQRVPGLSEMIPYFTWWDVVGNVIRHLKRGAEDADGGQPDGLIFLDWHRGLMSDEFFAAVGCPAGVFDLFVSLAGGGANVAPELSDKNRSLVQAMAQLLELGVDSSPQGQAADVWRCAAAIAVLTWDGRASLQHADQAALDAAVRRVCDTVSRAPSSSRFHTHMATGAFLASLNASSAEHCASLETYWATSQTGELPRYAGVRAQCQEIWAKKGLDRC